jgi:hypothetical protein
VRGPVLGGAGHRHRRSAPLSRHLILRVTLPAVSRYVPSRLELSRSLCSGVPVRISCWMRLTRTLYEHFFNRPWCGAYRHETRRRYCSQPWWLTGKAVGSQKVLRYVCVNSCPRNLLLTDISYLRPMGHPRQHHHTPTRNNISSRATRTPYWPYTTELR